MDINVFKRYAQAMENVAESQNKVKEYRDKLKFVKDLFEANPKFVMFLDTPFVEKSIKLSVLDKIFKDNVDTTVLNFIKIILQDGIIKYFKNIYIEYKHLSNNYCGILEGKIFTPKEISSDKIFEICSAFEKKLGKKVDLDIVYDRSLIGGIKVIIKDTIYDYSVDTMIENMKKKLILK